jgi:hypothetical protein
LDTETAEGLALARLAEWRGTGYGAWRAMLDAKDLRQVLGGDGRRYSVVSYALDDGDGRVRMVVAVDDGGWSALVPLVRDEIMMTDGSFVG